MRLSKARKACVTAMMKDTIFEAANSVLEQHGTGGLTMDRVATTAELATASLYNYFDDKDDLLRFIYARLVEPFFLALEEIVGAGLPAPQKLERILRTALEHSHQHKGLIRLLVESNQESHVRRIARPRMLRILTGIFERGIREGSFRAHDSAQTGRMFQGCFSELFEMQAEGASKEAVNRYVEVLIDTIRSGFSIHLATSPEPRDGCARPQSCGRSSDC
jgi:AcrR family transcriptional regulator